MLYNYQRAAKYFGDQGCKFGSVCILCGVIDEWPKWHEAALRPVGPKIVDQEFFYFDAPRMFGFILGGKWEEVAYSPGDAYVCNMGEHEILHWRKWKGEAGVARSDDSPKWAHHYVAGTGRGKVLRDPWTDSLTVRDGAVYERLIYRRAQ